MADSTCLVRGFSYPSVIPNESKQGHLMLALGDSVSFGRFLNDSLSWEKRSAFSQKNYVEEAEQFSRPGSVAQMKAFFEAHYTKIAAKKAADVVQQEGGEVCKNNVNDEQWAVVSNVPLNVHVMETKSVDMMDGKENLGVYKERSSIVVVETVVDQENVVVPGDSVLEERPAEKSLENKATEGSRVILENEDSEDRSMGKSWENARIPAKEGLEERPVGGSHAQLHNLENQDVPKSPVKLNNLESHYAVLASENSETTEKERLSVKPDTVASDDRNAKSARIAPKTWKDPSTLAKQVSHLKKESNATQGTTKDVEKSPSSSLHTLSETSLKEPSSATVKTDYSRLSCSSNTQSDSLLSNPAAIPQLNGTRTETARVSSSLSKSARWQLFSAVFSKSLREKSAQKNKQFQKHEENMNASKSQKMQLRKPLKEKARNRFRRLFSCFKDPSVLEVEEISENRGTVSMPPARLNKNSSRNIGVNTSKSFTRYVPPNVQQ